MTNSDKFTPLADAKNRVLGKVGTKRRDNYERELVIDRIKSLFNWGELSRMLAGTRAVVLKNKYPKKHDVFIQDLTESTRQVLIRHGYLPAPDCDIYIGGVKVEGVVSIEYDCDGTHHEQPEGEFYAESFTD